MTFNERPPVHIESADEAITIGRALDFVNSNRPSLVVQPEIFETAGTLRDTLLLNSFSFVAHLPPEVKNRLDASEVTDDSIIEYEPDDTDAMSEDAELERSVAMEQYQARRKLTDVPGEQWPVIKRALRYYGRHAPAPTAGAEAKLVLRSHRSHPQLLPKLPVRATTRLINTFLG